jgi:predicted  nucleic acid-binding Zn-ribbon protein
MNGTPTPEPNSFLQFWIIVGFVAMVIGQIVTIVVMLSNRKQKREVNFAFAPASKAEHDQHVADTANNFHAVRAEMAADRKANEIHASQRSQTIFRELKDNRERLEDQISNLDKKVAGLETASELQTQQLARLDTKLDRIIENKLT